MKSRILTWATIVVSIIAITGCCGSGKVVRDSKTYAAEVMASMLRERSASQRLMEGALAAKARGDNTACERLAAPAMVIQAKAQRQAYRALWLAGLPYPAADGSVSSGAEQADPGPSPAPKSVDSVCK